MMSRSGRVIAVKDDQLVVRFEGASACGSCRANKVCGSGSTTDLVLDGGCGSRVGDQVDVDVDAGTAFRALAVAYLLPVAGFLAGMAVASAGGLGDLGVAGISFAGLGLGLIASRRLGRHPSLQPVPRLAASEFND
ncbi:sigma-E factor regulatory protein [Azoarcus olearius]|uniref:SoxR reducing system RseC family protein n=1 Tax=Azoarcus sp. (strain BH72) TaxID=418699 RepID=UPI0008061738|nr:SoxR reducing system RseC family protein [Azoarcus olearius]ANQ83645.1 sigma-E factor regulatory protein [Azoarcus olearius]